MFKPVLTGLVLFSTLGVLISREVLMRVGLEPGYLLVGLGALAIALLLVFRSVPLILAAGLLALALNLPEATLTGYGLDKDVLLGLLLTVLLIPFVQRTGIR